MVSDPDMDVVLGDTAGEADGAGVTEDMVDAADAGSEASDAGEGATMHAFDVLRAGATAAASSGGASAAGTLAHIPAGPCTKSWSHFSAVPGECAEAGDGGCIMGVDEAGRGPVLGPMVYAVCYTPASQRERLGKVGFDDSKVLKESERDGLFDQVLEAPEWIGWAVTACSPQDISESMLRR
nr:Ribonuclease H2 subunit A [Polyrhizophydium stewartii]